MTRAKPVTVRPEDLSAEQRMVARAEGETIRIHFTADGFEALGYTWHRGQGLSVPRGHQRWPEVADWIELSPEQQAERWGEQKFAPGPWPGPRGYYDPSDPRRPGFAPVVRELAEERLRGVAPED
jgi:hypothetical protein